METYQAPAPGQVEVKVDPQSSRLQILEPFKAWDGKDIQVSTTQPVSLCPRHRENMAHTPNALWVELPCFCLMPRRSKADSVLTS